MREVPVTHEKTYMERGLPGRVPGAGRSRRLLDSRLKRAGTKQIRPTLL
jgi:hypothetical protein